MFKAQNLPQDSYYTRNFDIITNEIKSSHKSLHKESYLPIIQSSKIYNPSMHVSNSNAKNNYKNKTLNASGYDFNIINQRRNNKSTIAVEKQGGKEREREREGQKSDENGETNMRKAYHFTRYKEENDISAKRFRKDYEDVMKDKTFHRKKGWIKDYIGDEINTINHCLKRY